MGGMEKGRGMGVDGWWMGGKGGGVLGRRRGGEVPSIINHSGFLTRSESGCGSRSDSQFVSSASLISSLVRWRMKTGLPRHLMMTCNHSSAFCNWASCGIKLYRSRAAQCEGGLTFLPSGIAAKSISTFAWARTSAEADMLTRKSVVPEYQPL